MALKNKNNSKKLYIFLILAGIVCFLLASSVMPFVSEAKGNEVPDVLLCFVCAVPFFAGSKKASIFALAAGFFADLFINSPTALSPVVFLACVWIVPAVAKLFSRTGTLVISICTLPCILLRAAVGIISTLISVDGAGFARVMSDFSPLSIVFNFACAICVSFVMRFVAKKLRIQSVI